MKLFGALQRLLLFFAVLFCTKECFAFAPMCDARGASIEAKTPVLDITGGEIIAGVSSEGEVAPCSPSPTAKDPLPSKGSLEKFFSSFGSDALRPSTWDEYDLFHLPSDEPIASSENRLRPRDFVATLDRPPR